MLNIEKPIYVHHNHHRNEIRQVLLENSNYHVRPTATVGSDFGLVYYDTVLKHVMVWNGYVWKILSDADEHNYSIEKVLMEDIWTDSKDIPTDETTANSSLIVSKIVSEPLTYVTDSYSFQSTNLYDIVPTKYGAFYLPVITTYDDVIIPQGTNNYKIENNIVTFYDGFINNGGLLVDETHPPKITYWRYIGSKGDIAGVSSTITSSYQVQNTDITYTQFINMQMPFVVQNNNIISVYVNGVLTMNWAYNYTSNIITFDQTALDYFFDIDDVINITYKN